MKSSHTRPRPCSDRNTVTARILVCDGWLIRGEACCRSYSVGFRPQERGRLARSFLGCRRAGGTPAVPGFRVGLRVLRSRPLPTPPRTQAEGGGGGRAEANGRNHHER